MVSWVLAVKEWWLCRSAGGAVWSLLSHEGNAHAALQVAAVIAASSDVTLI